MKRILAPAEYTFDASAKTITISGFTPVLEYITTIINITDNILIYSVTNIALKGTLASQVITLQYDTTTMSDTDELQIQYNDPAYIQPTSLASIPLASDAATQTTLAAVLAKITADPATQTTLAAILAKIIAAPSTEAKQDSIITLLTTLAGLDYSTEAKQDTIISGLASIAAALGGTLGIAGTVTANAGTNLNTSALALESGGNLAAILAKLSADPSTAALQTTGNSTLSSILAKIIATPATEAKQDTLIAKDFATQTTLAAVLAKIIASPATEAKQDTLIAKDFATQTTLAAILAKIIAAPSTEAKQDTGNTALAAIQTAIQLLDNAVSGNGYNITQMNGANVTMGNGASGTGVQRVTIASDSTGVIGLLPKTSGGLTTFRSIDVDETEEEIKATAGQLFGWFIYNNAATTIYVKFYNATAANVTVGTTTPVITVPIPAGAGANVEYTNGVAFSTAITIAATTGVADNNTGAPAANDIVANIFYK